MAAVRFPPNVTSVTLVTSGVVAPASGVVTCTVAEATDLVQAIGKGPGTDGVIDSATTTVRLKFPASITSITIGGNVIAVAAGISGAIPAQAAADFLFGCKQVDGYFQLVTG